MNPNGPRFLDVTQGLGLVLTGDHVCWADLDGDGSTDLVAGDFVWWNDGGTRFTCGQKVGGCVAADFDNDGNVDLFSFTQMKLYRNIGGRRFEEFPLPPFPEEMHSCGACWADLTGNGYVDLIVCGYEKEVLVPATETENERVDLIPLPGLILLNMKGEGFEIGLTITGLHTRGVTACDFNRSGRPSAYLSNYRLQPNLLFMSSKDHPFGDFASPFNVVGTTFPWFGSQSIGACWGGFGDKGDMDLLVVNFAHQDPERGDQPKSRIFRNRGTGGRHTFADMGECGIFYQESYASPAADNDGRLDFYITTAYDIASFDRPNFPVLFHNEGGYRFSDETTGSGLDALPPTYQAAWADFDNDGNLAPVTAGKLLRNQVTYGHWIHITLAGDGRKVNRSAIGAQVRIRLGDRALVRQVEAGTGQGNQNDLRLHFGLGGHAGNVDLDIWWPNGATQTVADVRPDQIVQVKDRG